MAQMLIRQLDEEVKRKLRRRAQANGRSTEAEVRDILQAAVRGDGDPTGRLGSKIAARFAGLDFEGEIVERRGQPPRPASLEP